MSKQQTTKTFEAVVNSLLETNPEFKFMRFELEEERFASGRPMLSIVVVNGAIVLSEFKELERLFNIGSIRTEDNKLKIFIVGLNEGVEL